MKKFSTVAWDDEAKTMLAQALSAETLPIVEDEISKGISLLWRCESESGFAFMVTREEFNPHELVIVACVGKNVFQFAEFFFRAAEKKNASIRVHVIKKSLLRLWERLGLKTSEYVLRR